MANVARNTPAEVVKKIMNTVAFGSVDDLKAAQRNTYKMGNNVKKMGYPSVYRFLKQYIHPIDGSQFQGLTLLHVAVLTGEPDIVEETMNFGTDLERPSGATLDPEFAEKTPRGLADVMIVRSKSPEQAAAFKAIKSLLLKHGAKPKMKTTITGKKLAFPENAVNVQYYRNASAALNRMLSQPQFDTRKARKSRKARKTRKNLG